MSLIGAQPIKIVSNAKKSSICWSLIILANFCCPRQVDGFKKSNTALAASLCCPEPMVSRFQLKSSLGRTCRLVQAECEASRSKADDQNEEIRGTEHGVSASKLMLSNRLRFVKVLPVPSCRCQIGLLVSAICPGQRFSRLHSASAVFRDACF